MECAADRAAFATAETCASALECTDGAEANICAAIKLPRKPGEPSSRGYYPQTLIHEALLFARADAEACHLERAESATVGDASYRFTLRVGMRGAIVDATMENTPNARAAACIRAVLRKVKIRDFVQSLEGEVKGSFDLKAVRALVRIERVKAAGTERPELSLAYARGRLRECYQAMLIDKPSQSGAVAFSFVLDEKPVLGERVADKRPESFNPVTDVKLGVSGTLDPAIADCVRATLMDVRFDRVNTRAGERTEGTIVFSVPTPK